MERILKEAFTVRLDKEGKELEKPRYWKSWIKGNRTAIFNSGIEYDYLQYEQVTEVIKLPTLIEFVETANEFKINNQCKEGLTDMQNHHNALAIFADHINDYTDFLKTQLSKGQFIATDEDGNVLVEPECQCDDGQEEYDCVKENCSQTYYAERFQKAEEAVIFVGDNSRIDHTHWYYMGQDISDYDTLNQALNQGVVFYMKIK